MHAGTRAVGAEVPSDFFPSGNCGPSDARFSLLPKEMNLFLLKKKKTLKNLFQSYFVSEIC